MSALQWAVLIFAVIAVVAIYFFSRREGSSVPPPPITSDDDDPLFKSPRTRQMDIFTAPAPAPAPVAGKDPLPPGGPPRVGPDPGLAADDRFAKDFAPRLPPLAQPTPVAPAAPAARGPIVTSGRSFDEHGVGEPRRIPPMIGTPILPEETAGSRQMPSSKSPSLIAKAGPTAATSAQKIVSLLIIARNNGVVSGEAVHAALRAQGLQYGQRQIYHRLHEGKTVFSVASMLKPGTLEPDQARGFSAPGLAVFMVLPGALPPIAALRDMIKSSQAIARALNADVFDGKRQPLTMVATRALHEDIESWEAERTA